MQVSEFGDCVRRLFGADATDIAPIRFCSQIANRRRRCYVGKPKQLAAFLRAHPAVCDELQIVKLVTDGFITLYYNTKGKTGVKEFAWPPPEADTVLYMKEGYETMSCVKPLDLFERDCTLGIDVTMSWDAARRSSALADEDKDDGMDA